MRYRRIHARVGRALLSTLAAVLLCTSSASGAETAPRDALQRRVRAQLRSFTSWLDANNAGGYVGEIGWPDDFRGDGAEWNALARGWFEVADAHDLWVSAWATGEWWGGGYRLSVYENAAPDLPGIDHINTQAKILEAAAATGGQRIGINVNGGEFGSPIALKEATFSNENPGAYNTRYHYDRQLTFDLLERRGLGHVRIPFRWERIQPRPGGPLDEEEVARLRQAVARAWDAGLRSVLDVHNYGAYYLARDGVGVRTPIGSRDLSVGDFADLWRRLSQVFRNDDRVLMYALMAEPNALPRVNGERPAKLWERASQAALSAIRAGGDRKLIAVPGYGWDSLQVFMRNHPNGWIDDPADNFVYEVHHYWDRDWSGDYDRSYADEVAAAERAGW